MSFLVVRGCGSAKVTRGVASGVVELCSVVCVRSGEVTLISVCGVVVIGFGVTRGVVRSIKGVCLGWELSRELAGGAIDFGMVSELVGEVGSTSIAGFS